MSESSSTELAAKKSRRIDAVIDKASHKKNTGRRKKEQKKLKQEVAHPQGSS